MKFDLSVQPEWCRALPLQQQSVLFLGARGPDGAPKTHPAKAIQRAYRATVFMAGKYGRMLDYGEKADSFMSLDRFADDAAWLEDVDSFFDAADGVPFHFYHHLMCGAEILGYKHPDQRFRLRWLYFYLLCVDKLHLKSESEEEMDARLSDWEQKYWDSAGSSTPPDLDVCAHCEFPANEPLHDPKYGAHPFQPKIKEPDAPGEPDDVFGVPV